MTDDGGRPLLYGHFESGNVYKVALMLALCGQPFDYRHVDLFAGATKDPAFRAISPYGEVPVLTHGGANHVQSGVILSYLAETLGRFGAETEAERRRIAEWLAWENQRMLGGLAILRFQRRFVPDVDPAVLTFFQGRAETALAQLDGHLAGRSFIATDRPTIADIACAGYAVFIEQADLDPGRWPAIQGWLARIAVLPGWQGPYDLLPTEDRAAE